MPNQFIYLGHFFDKSWHVGIVGDDNSESNVNFIHVMRVANAALVKGAVQTIFGIKFEKRGDANMISYIGNPIEIEDAFIELVCLYRKNT